MDLKIALIILQVIASVGLIATVLLQSGKSAGMSGSITGGAEAVFGKKKGMDALFSKLSTIFAVAFMLITLLASIL